MRNFGPTSHAMDWLVDRCRLLQRRSETLYLKFHHGEYITLDSDDMVMMAAEMVVRYYMAGLDPRDFPQWMDNMDNAWQEHIEEPDEIISDSEDSQWDDYDDIFP